MAEGQNVCSENKEIRETMRQMRVVNKGIRKVDAKALVTGRAVYTNDIASSDSLIVKLVRSPHAHALIKEINTTRAEALPGIECGLRRNIDNRIAFCFSCGILRRSHADDRTVQFVHQYINSLHKRMDCC